LAASQTCISSYACTRVWSTWLQEPVDSRNETDDSVKLLARFEYLSSGEVQARSLLRSWVSIKAVLRWDVTGDDLRAARRANPAGPPPTVTTS
jgi:hypothetical protein